MSSRMLPVPDALVGERVDAALARMLGLSRSRCAELAGEGHVLINGVAAGKSDRLGAMDIIEVSIPEPENKPTPVTDMAILYDDEDIVVVDKPVGVAAHTGPGWRDPRSWATWKRLAIASPATALPSARASCTALTWAPRVR